MLSPAPSSGVDQCNCNALRKAARQISRLYDACLQPTGLKITQYLILAVLNEAGGSPVNALAERLDIERTAMGKMVGLLQRDAIVSIEPSPADARSRIVALTPEGRALFERAVPLWLDAQRQFAELNGSERVASLRRAASEMKTDRR